MVPPLVAAAVPAGIAAVGSLFGRERANKANAKLAREQMAFQERMSSTSWQRAVEDMKLAGINPMLAFAQGGASSPSGQTARMEDVLGPAVSSAMSMMRMRAELKLVQQQTETTRQVGYKAMSEGSFIQTQNHILGAGVMRGLHITPFGVIQKRLDTALREQQVLLTEAQRRALQFSPFMSRFIGTEGPKRTMKFFTDRRKERQ